MLGEKWKNLSDTDRRPYEEKAAADKKRYEEEKANYNVMISPSPSFSWILNEDPVTDLISHRRPRRKKKNRLKFPFHSPIL